jgi:hypothetical protein
MQTAYPFVPASAKGDVTDPDTYSGGTSYTTLKSVVVPAAPGGLGIFNARVAFEARVTANPNTVTARVVVTDSVGTSYTSGEVTHNTTAFSAKSVQVGPLFLVGAVTVEVQAWSGNANAAVPQVKNVRVSSIYG